MHLNKGTYIIVLYVVKSQRIQIGKLGRFQFKKGYYAYVGSAFGPGGLNSRIKHHIEPKKRYHWHIDYLNPAVKEVWVSDPGERLEHEWAGSLGKIASDQIPGFGCSDCSCESHLFYFNSFVFLQNSLKELGKKKCTLVVDPQIKFESTQFPRIFKLTPK